jgi:hypothetical protein
MGQQLAEGDHMKITVEINGEQQTFDLPEDTIQGLQQIARRNGISFTAALQQAIASGNFVESAKAAGGKVLIEKDNQLREVRESQPA